MPFPVALQSPLKRRKKQAPTSGRTRFEDNLAEESRKHLYADRLKEWKETYDRLKLARDEIEVGEDKLKLIEQFFPALQQAFIKSSQGAAEIGSRTPINDVNLEGLNDMVLYGQHLVHKFHAVCARYKAEDFANPKDQRIGKFPKRCQMGLCVHKITIPAVMDMCLNAYEYLLPHSVKERHTDIQPNVNLFPWVLPGQGEADNALLSQLTQQRGQEPQQ